MPEKIKIVMIDDEADLCLLVKGNLEDTKEFEVVTVSDPTQAEAVCVKEKPHIILLDNVMPQKKGAEIAKILKKNEATKAIPIIMVSGKGEMVYSKKKNTFQWLPNNPMAQGRGQIAEGKDPEALSRAYGVEDYVSKPFMTDLLIQVIKEVLERTREARGEEA